VFAQVKLFHRSTSTETTLAVTSVVVTVPKLLPVAGEQPASLCSRRGAQQSESPHATLAVFSTSGFGAATQSPLNNQVPSAKSAIVSERLGQIQRRPGTELAQIEQQAHDQHHPSSPHHSRDAHSCNHRSQRGAVAFRTLPGCPRELLQNRTHQR